MSEQARTLLETRYRADDIYARFGRYLKEIAMESAHQTSAGQKSRQSADEAPAPSHAEVAQ